MRIRTNDPRSTLTEFGSSCARKMSDTHPRGQCPSRRRPSARRWTRKQQRSRLSRKRRRRNQPQRRPNQTRRRRLSRRSEQSGIIDAQVAAAEAQREKRPAEANDREEQEAKRQRYGRTIRQGHRHMEVPSQWINEIDLQDANSVSSSDPVVGNPWHVPNGDAHAYLRSGTHLRGYKGAHADTNERSCSTGRAHAAS